MSLPPVYVATVYVPGYLPMSDEPAAFDTAREAWAWLADERQRDEDAAPDDSDTGEYSEWLAALRHIASNDHEHGNRHEDWPTNASGSGYVHADTPGSDSPHDLGLIYRVSRVDHADYPHEAGYLPDCRACEARCHCDGESAECVYGGDHDC